MAKRMIGDGFCKSSKVYRFEATAAPVPFNHKFLQRVPIEQLRARVSRCTKMYPQFSDWAISLLSKFEAVRGSSENPLKKYATKLISDTKTGLVLKEPRLIESVEEQFAETYPTS